MLAPSNDDPPPGDYNSFMRFAEMKKPRGLRRAALAVVLIAGSSRSGQTQAVPVPTQHPRVVAALDAIRADNAWTLDQQASICEIPAPPFRETARAAEYKRRFELLGLKDVRIDMEGNVIATRPGKGNGPSVMVAGHLDTVFPEGTDVRVTRQGTVMKGPGIGDDCRGLAVILQVAKSFDKAGVETDGTIYFVGDVGEEGAGNLRGVRHLMTKELHGEVDYFISVDGAGLRVTSRAVGSHRYRVAFKGPGGHSYAAFGIPNPIHALGRAIAKISDIRVPAEPRTTFSVSVVSGGTSVNSIPAMGVMDVDMRSESVDALNSLDARVRGAILAALSEENARWSDATPASRLTVVIDTIGIRPTGAQSDDALIVRTALDAGRSLGFAEPTEASSTDANLPISMGIPAIKIGGGGLGTGMHSLAESYDDTDRGYLGPQWVSLIVVALAKVR